MFARLISAAELTLASTIASQDKYRAALNSVRLEPGLAIATDGHILATIKTSTPDPADFPHKPGLEHSTAFRNITIPASVCNAALKALPKRHPVHVLQHAALWLSETSAALYVHDLESWLEFPWNPEKCGSYPDWRYVWPTVKPRSHVQRLALDVSFLDTIATLAQKTLGKKRGEQTQVDWRFYGETHPAAFYAASGDTTLQGIIMPMVLSDAASFECPGVAS